MKIATSESIRGMMKFLKDLKKSELLESIKSMDQAAMDEGDAPIVQPFIDQLDALLAVAQEGIETEPAAALDNLVRAVTRAQASKNARPENKKTAHENLSKVMGQARALLNSLA